jgi:N-acetylgalactosamine kinase
MEKASKRLCNDPEHTPTFGSIAELARGSSINQKRYEDLYHAFVTTHGVPPAYIARCPGRVNLIGEHIDYCGYGVLPMALEQDIAIAFAPNDDNVLVISNTDNKYKPVEISAKDYAISGVEWYNYFLCGFKGITEKYSIANSRGINIVVDGNIPPSSGLSSSSALVCCASLVTLVANDIQLPTKKDLADLCASSERFIGTQGGGMDQATSFLAEAGQAMLIDFNPLRFKEVKLPQGYTFVIANSLVSKNKAASSSFNERVIECRLSAKIIAEKNGKDWKSINKLLELQLALGMELKDMTEVVSKCLHEEPYTYSEICQLLNVQNLSDEVLMEMNDSARQTAGELKEFFLFQRAMHVFSESYRVIQFQEASTAGGDVGTNLGNLMNQSHASCSGLYECSCGELDQLVKLCVTNGAKGSRLTGAGWGGCCVSLVDENQLELFLDGVASDFYKKPKEEIKTSLFATKPGSGAALCMFKE